MRLLLFRSLWTNGFALAAALADVAGGHYDGVEGPLPASPAERDVYVARLRETGVPYIAEVVTGGGYVPTQFSMGGHLEDLKRALDFAAPAAPRFVTALAGSDTWTANEAVEFFGRAIEIARQRGVVISFETHRSRPTFSPWATARLLRQLPELRLTCDFSHWCCVCERLVMDEEPGLLAQFAAHAHHVHARVGYAQGPQVPHPAAPEYHEALCAHERWWDVIGAARSRAGAGEFTMTPEFGPDGYLQAAPFTGQPAADLDEINGWMARRQRERLASCEAIELPGGVP